MVERPAHTRQLWIGTYPVAGQGMPTGLGEGIWTVTLDTESGQLDNPRQVATTPAPSFLAHGLVDGALYAVNEEVRGGLSAFLIDHESLKLVGRAPTGGEHPCHLLVSPESSAVLVANYTSGSVARIRVGVDGVPADEPGQLLVLDGSGPIRERQESPHAHYLLKAPDDGPPLVVDLGADCIRHLRVDRGSGALIQERIAVTMPPGTGPRHAVFSADGRHLYVLGELDGLLHTVAWDPSATRGTVIDSTRAVPGEGSRVDLSHIVRSGSELIIGSRGSHVMSVHRLGADGLPTFHRALGLPGSWPRHHALVDGWLVVAQQRSGGVAVLDLSGRVRGHAAIPSPACILARTTDPDSGAL